MPVYYKCVKRLGYYNILLCIWDDLQTRSNNKHESSGVQLFLNILQQKQNLKLQKVVIMLIFPSFSWFSRKLQGN